MKLESVSVKRFRSIEDGTLTNCGGFNVLIGKNNAGKSNILSAIHAFFTCIQGGNVVILNPPIGQEIDFFRGETDSHIEITLTFSLLLAERDALIRDIVTEAPQMKNAVDGLDPSLRLSVTVNITPPPTRFGFVSKIALGGTVRPGAKRPASEKMILRVSDEAASELHDKLAHYQQWTEQAEALPTLLDRIESIYGTSMREKSRERSLPPLRYLFRELFPSKITDRIDRELLETLETIIDEATSREELSRAVQALATEIQDLSLDYTRVQCDIQVMPLRTDTTYGHIVRLEPLDVVAKLMCSK